MAFLVALVEWSFLASALAAAPSVERITYRGWPNSLRLVNDSVEVIAVPAVGRVMSFRFRDGANVFWEDAALAGQHGDATGRRWVNFGGDKTWPAPESEWKSFTKQGWMPPPAFDALPVEGRVDGETIVLTSPIDPFYGIRTVRRISLAASGPVLTIATTYERVLGSPTKVSIWVITQFAEPEAVLVPVPAPSRFPDGHYVFGDKPWPQVRREHSWLRLTRDPAKAHKLGSDADRMLWVGPHVLCLVAAPRRAGAEYPDRGASVEVYTNPNPKPYVELETLGPLRPLAPGGSIHHSNTYTLWRRTPAGLEADARRAFAAALASELSVHP
jgi:hypothetical protein